MMTLLHLNLWSFGLVDAVESEGEQNAKMVVFKFYCDFICIVNELRRSF